MVLEEQEGNLGKKGEGKLTLICHKCTFILYEWVNFLATSQIYYWHIPFQRRMLSVLTLITQRGNPVTNFQPSKMSLWILFRKMKSFKYWGLCNDTLLLPVRLFFSFLIPDTSELRGEFWLKWESDMTLNFCVFKRLSAVYSNGYVHETIYLLQ